MTVSKSILGICAVSITLALVGCGSGSQEIPLANVPPPPPGFGKAVTTPKTPKGGSPENATQLSR